MRENQYESSSSTQNEKWSAPRSISRSVLGEVALGSELHAHEQPHLLLDRLDERGDGFEAVASLESAVEMHEGDTRRFLGGPARLDDVLDGLLFHFRIADVAAGRAEAAVEAARPEFADRVDIDAEVGALQHADPGHRNVARREPVVPPGAPRHADGIALAVPLVVDLVQPGPANERVGRRLREALRDGRVHPDLRLQTGAGRDDELEPGAEPCPRPGNAPRPVQRHVVGDPDSSAEQIDLELTRVHPHSRLHRTPPLVSERPVVSAVPAGTIAAGISLRGPRRRRPSRARRRPTTRRRPRR